MNKKALESHLVIAIIILVSFVLLLFLYKGLLNQLSATAQDQQCFTSALANAYTKLGGVEVTKLDCPTHYQAIKGAELNPTHAQKKWDTVLEITERSGKRAAFTLPYNEQGFYEYALNEVVAKEMKSCWKRLGEGKLPLFDEWLKDNTKTGSKAICVICSRLEFDAEVRERVGKTEITSLTEWLRNNPSQQYRVGEDTVLSMYEYIQDPDTYDANMQPEYKYAVDKPLAVVFSRTNRHFFRAWIGEVVADGWTYTKEGVSAAYDWITHKEAELSDVEQQEQQQPEFTPKADVRGWDLLLVVPYDHVGSYCGYLVN